MSVLDWIDYMKWCFTQLPSYAGDPDPMPHGADSRCRKTLNRWREDKIMSSGSSRVTEWRKLQSGIPL